MAMATTTATTTNMSEHTVPLGTSGVPTSTQLPTTVQTNPTPPNDMYYNNPAQSTDYKKTAQYRHALTCDSSVDKIYKNMDNLMQKFNSKTGAYKRANDSSKANIILDFLLEKDTYNSITNIVNDITKFRLTTLKCIAGDKLNCPEKKMLDRIRINKELDKITDVLEKYSSTVRKMLDWCFFVLNEYSNDCSINDTVDPKKIERLYRAISDIGATKTSSIRNFDWIWFVVGISTGLLFGFFFGYLVAKK